MAHLKSVRGPLCGIRILEFGTIGPVPYAGMLLSDLGADIVRIDRAGDSKRARDTSRRGRRSFPLDLKDPAHRKCAYDLALNADVLIEGFRPGVMERLGLGPDQLLVDNPKLVYGRMTGWGQFGPLSSKAGHDINYLAISGALSAIGPTGEPPSVPLNLLGDYGAGSLFLLVGILAALLSAKVSGRGQVIDCAICDNVVSMLSLFHDLTTLGQWQEKRESNLLDGGAHFYATYECADGKYIAVGALEPQFYSELLRILRLSGAPFASQMDRSTWPEAKKRLRAIFLTRPRDEWIAIFEGVDACVSPVLSLKESIGNVHLAARKCFIEKNTMVESTPVPRFSMSELALQAGYAFASIDDLRAYWRPTHG